MRKFFTLTLTLLVIISSVLSVSAIDINGDSNLSAIALNAPSSTSNNSRVAIFPEDFGDGSGYPDITYSKAYLENNFYLLLVVTDLGNGRFRYAADAWWLTPPTYREIDSLAIAVQNCALVSGSCSGWVSFDEESGNKGNNSQPIHRQYEVPLEQSDFVRCVDGNWQGYGVLWDIPDNKASTVFDRSYITYRNFKFHIEFDAYVLYPRQESYFNATASYHHSQTHLSSTPTLTISNNQSSYAIVIQEETTAIPVCIELDDAIHYVP